MNRYRKAWVAVAGALAQIAVVLDQALDDGVLPPAWVPWVRVTLALLTAVGVYAVPNAPRVVYVRGRGDLGAARPGLLGTLAALAAAALLIVASALAGPADARGAVEHVDVTRACTYPGAILDVAFDLEKPRVGVWGHVPDDGAATVQLRHQGAAAGPDGHWATYPAASGGEGHLRVQVGGIPYWDAVRVVHGGWTSSPAIAQECAA